MFNPLEAKVTDNFAKILFAYPRIDTLNGSSQTVFQNHIPEVLPFAGCFWGQVSTGDVGPPQTLKLLKGGKFYLVVLIRLEHGLIHFDPDLAGEEVLHECFLQ